MLVIYSLTILVTLACLLKYFLHKYDQHHYRPSTITTNKAERAPRYPHLDPFFGLDLALRTWRDFQRGELAEGQRRRHAQYGRTFTTTTTSSSSSSLGRGGGAGECIFTIEPANIRAVTTHAFSAFGKASWVAEAAKHVGAGVLLNEGAAWKHSRAMLKPIFMGGGARMDDPALLEPHVRRLVATMRALSSSSSSSSSSSPETDAPGGASLPVQAQAQAQAQGEGEKGKAASFDFHELASMFTLDVVTEFLFGKSTLCLQSPRRQDGRDGVDFLALVREFEGPSGEFIAVGPLAWLGLATSYWRLLRVVDGMKAFFRRQLNDMIEETKTSCGGGGESRSDSSHGRGEEEEEKKKEAPQSHSPSVFRAMKAAGASDEQIQGEVQNIFFASYDTTSAFLANVMHVLVHHPGIQLKLRREIGLLGGRLPTNKDLASFEYLRWFLMEALRLYSPVSSHSRTAKVDTVLPRGGGGDGLQPLLVRAGATVVWSTYALNRDPQWYGPDWAVFRPERWATCGGGGLVGGGGGMGQQQEHRPKGTSESESVGEGEDAEEGVLLTDATLNRPACKGTTALTGGSGAGDTTGASDLAEEVAVVGPRWRDFFMPFGSGPRSCLGQQMVQSEVAYVIVRLLQEFQEMRPAGVHDVHQDGAAASRQSCFREAKAVSFYNADGVVISVE